MGAVNANMQRAPLSIGIILGSLTVAATTVGATTCGEIYPGAKIGPPPDWNFWAYGSACYVHWVPKDALDQVRLLGQCQNTIGARFVHFEINSEMGDTLCLFKIPGMNPSASTEAEAPPVVPEAEPHKSVTLAKVSEDIQPSAKTRRPSRDKTHGKRTPRKTKNTAARKTKILAAKKNGVQVRPTSSHIEQQPRLQRRIRSGEQIASSRTDIRINGSPFLLKPVSSACFVSVHNCKP